ncbi:tandem-95 repeat protein [Microvirga zambiensis]|uniref:tandem-95 repeat protein n=1 Tax=Microvirga zambiensis TaxID=1402137 RepID=UPI00191E947C|nr:tandem-95 repeat protein [Microvirga zambiensis]
MSDALIAAFNAATTWQAALAAIKNEEYAALLLEESHRNKLTDLPDDGGREQAIGLGVLEIKTLFGDYTTVEEIKAAVQLQIEVEHEKFRIIGAVGTAQGVGEMKTALEIVETLNTHRQDLIEAWSNSTDPDAQARAAALEVEEYTVVLKRLAAELNNGDYLNRLAEKMMVARAETGPFYGVGTLVAALDNADRAIATDRLLEAFNDAGSWQEALAAIKDNASALLDQEHQDMLDDLPEDGGREQAIGLGVLEIRTLFGDFASLETLITEVRYQIEVEHAKFAALNAINAATEENMVAVLKEHIANLNDHRQELIEKWSMSADPDAQARAEELSAEEYTLVLAEIVSHFDDATYMAGLAEAILGSEQFFGVGALVTALKAADVALDSPVAPATQSVTTDEDAVITHDIGATDPNGDPLAYSVKSGEGPQKGTVTFADGKFTYTPDENGNGTDTFTIVISDGEHSVEQVVTVTITPVNDAPVASATGNSASGDEDKAVVGELPAATDVDGDDITYELVNPVAGLTLNADGTYRYVPAADFNGVVTFEYRAIDEHGEKSEPRTFTLTINPVNDTPWDISLSKDKVVENAAAGTEIGKLVVSDPDGGTFTFELVDNAGGRFVIDTATGTLNVADGTKLDYEQATSHTVKIRVKDSAGATFEKTLTIGLTDVANETVTGTAGKDVLVGGTGKDVFNGGLGDDKLSGGLGNDVLTGGKGKDVFVFDSKLGTSSTDRKVNFDSIKDFSVKDDSLYLDNAIFKKLGAGTATSPKQLKSSFFTIGDKAKDKNDYIVYNNKTGVLSYDADGSGNGKAVEFAQLTKNLKMTYKDFFVI